MTDKNEYKEIIATLDRIIAMQDSMIENINGMVGKIDEMIADISSENDEWRRMTETGPR